MQIFDNKTNESLQVTPLTKIKLNESLTDESGNFKYYRNINGEKVPVKAWQQLYIY